MILYYSCLIYLLTNAFKIGHETLRQNNERQNSTVNYQLKVNDKTYLPHYHEFILLAQSKTAMSLFAQKFGGYLLRTF